MTAVEWLEKELKDRYPLMNSEPFFEQAKQIEKQDKIDFLVWLKENRWHVYKNGKWFTTTDQPYIDGEPRKTYTEKQVIEKYNNVPYNVQNEAN